MMYQDRFVVAIKNNGRVLREHGDTTYLPFGCEYSILLKNKNSVRALVRVEIDGVDATEGTSLIVPANGSVDFERFLKASNYDQGLKFKFIERTKKIEDGPRGIGAEDGLIRIEFEFEQQKAAYIPGPVYGSPIYHNYWGSRYRSMLIGSAGGDSVTSSGYVKGLSSNAADVKLGSSGVARGITAQAMNASFSASDSVQSFADQAPTLNDAGITVGGSVSDQKFTVGAWFPTDGVKHVMILKLLGQVGEQRVKKPVTVKTKQECPTCGTTNKFGTKFCKECGTGLSIV